jgi:hypothetical protein
LQAQAAALDPRAELDTLAAMRMLDVHSPITDGATLILSCYTAMNVDQKLLVTQLKLDLAGQLPRGGTAAAASPRCAPEGSMLLAPRDCRRLAVQRHKFA